MEAHQVNGCEISVEPGRVMVNMNPREEKPLAAADFADKPLAVGAVRSQVAFYGAFDDADEMVRCVSMSIADRAAVAALVAGWIAEGLDVQRLGSKEISKHIRAIEKREKEEAAQLKAQAEAAAAAGAPALNVPADPSPGDGEGAGADSNGDDTEGNPFSRATETPQVPEPAEAV